MGISDADAQRLADQAVREEENLKQQLAKQAIADRERQAMQHARDVELESDN